MQPKDAFFAKAALPMALADGAGRIRDVNEAWRTAFMPRRPTSPLPLGQLVVAAEQETLLAAIAVADGKPHDFTLSTRRGARTRMHFVADDEAAEGTLPDARGIVVTALPLPDAKRDLPATDPRFETAALVAMADRLPAVLYRWYRRANGETGHYYLSPSARDLFGVDPARLVDGTASVPIHPEDRSSYEASIENAVARMEDWHFECRLLLANGSVRWCRACGRPSRIGDEIVFDGVIVDVSQEHEAAQRLAEASDAMPGVVFQFEIRPDGSWVFPVMSAGLTRLFGIPAGTNEQGFDRLIASVHPDDAKRVITGILKVASERTDWSDEFRIKTSDGYRWARGESVRVVRADGRAYWNGYIVGIDDLKQVEEALREKENILVARDWMLEQSAALAKIGTWAWDEIAGKPIYFTDTVAAMHGVTPSGLAQLYDPSTGLASTIHPDDREAVKTVLREILQGKDYDVEFRIVRNDGTTIHVREIASPVFDETGKVVRSHGVIQDITAIKLREIEAEETRNRLRAQADGLTHLAQELDEARMRAEESNRAKSQFLANMSHEVRTPLNAILGFSEIIAAELFGPIGNQRYGTYARHIVESGRHLLALLDDLLDLAKIEAGKLQADPERLDVVPLVAQCVELIRIQNTKTDLRIDYRSDGAATIEIDPTQLRQIVLNVLSNAVKFTPDKGRIDVSVAHSGDRVEIAVVDKGIGIDPGDIERLLQPFERGASALEGRYQGAGLGLALVNRLVGLNGGTLAIDSSPGEGTSVRVTFPCVEGAAAVTPDISLARAAH